MYKNAILIIFTNLRLPGVPEKAERRIFSTLRAEVLYIFTSLDKASPAEENDA